jgi:TRAP-type mannitol/chloroaromatic compound transport system permease small subunit
VQALLGVSRAIDAAMHRIGVVGYWLLPVMVLVGVWNVFARFFGQAIEINLTSNLFIELQWYLFSVIIFLGAPYNILHNEHVRIDVVYDRLGSRQRAWVNLVGTALILIPFCGLIIYFGWDFIGNSWSIWEQSPDPSGLPRYPIKTLIAVGMGLLIIQGFSEMIKNAAFLLGSTSEMPASSVTSEQKIEQAEAEAAAEEARQAELTAQQADTPPAPHPAASASDAARHNQPSDIHPAAHADSEQTNAPAAQAQHKQAEQRTRQEDKS